MKKVAIVFLVASICAQQQNSNPTQPTQQVIQKPVDPDADTPRIVLQEFGKALNFFGNIIADPNNGKNVGANMAGIFGNIITIAAQAFKRTNNQELEKNLENLQEIFIELCTDPEFCKQLFDVVEQEATRVKRVIRSKP